MERTSCSLKKCFRGSAKLRLSFVGLHMLEAEDAHVGRRILRDCHDLEVIQARFGGLFGFDDALGGILAREEDEVGIAAVRRAQKQSLLDSVLRLAKRLWKASEASINACSRTPSFS